MDALLPAATLVLYRCAGWLLLMACNERMKEEFDTLHEAVIEILKVINAHLTELASRMDRAHV